ncbi:EthD domain-containing protein [Marinobacterium sp. D7]|uniref:EthD domain-containing protein n=1 Tax=Marinobacterium ramblicola TaxID=2849041 RepID=UPI001C2DA140|nr:EthD domain-containing protein [Marinobacterium ramblicola]MBV1788707.1 EthD domain-containing protein [Marinobacterium ramblicola]
MIKMIAAVCRRPGMTHAEYVSYLQHVHGAITLDNPLTLRSYLQNHAFDAAFGTASEPSHSMVVARDSVTELCWDSAEDMRATFSSEYVRTRVGPDGRNFSDESVALSLVAEEFEQPVAQPAVGGGAKVMHFLRAAEGLDLEAFFTRWAQAHEMALAAPEVTGSLRRCVHNRQRPEFNKMLAYFGGKDVPIYEGVASLWYDNASVIGAFRAYERALLEINAEADTAFYRPEQSYFIYATEVPIYSRDND